MGGEATGVQKTSQRLPFAAEYYIHVRCSGRRVGHARPLGRAGRPAGACSSRTVLLVRPPPPSVAMPRIFSFERELYATLSLMPLAVRRKLDLAGVKLSRRGWQAMPAAARRALAEVDVADEASLAALHHGPPRGSIAGGRGAPAAGPPLPEPRLALAVRPARRWPRALVGDLARPSPARRLVGARRRGALRPPPPRKPRLGRAPGAPPGGAARGWAPGADPV